MEDIVKRYEWGEIEPSDRNCKSFCTNLHIMHIITDLITILLFKVNAFTTERDDLCFTLSLLKKSGLCGAGGPASGAFCREERGLVRLGDAMRRRAFLGINEGIARMSVGDGRDVLHVGENRVGLGCDRLWAG